MNTEFVCLPAGSTAADAVIALQANEELLEVLNVVFLVDEEERLTAAIPLARLFAAHPTASLREMASDTLIQVTVEEHQDRIVELFDKYNLLTLPVVDGNGKLAGVITADDVISVLRQK
jgi:Mg/Co/Ni transporter MgtE